MIITTTQLDAIMPHANARIDVFLDPINAAMEEFMINTPKRQAAFIAQIAHESGELQFTTEIASGAAYDHRKDLGNTNDKALKRAKEHKTTPGRLYKGRGLIQLTGYYNYADCAMALHIDVERNPMLLALPENACRSAAWFWFNKGLNLHADNERFTDITRKINGGINGLEKRLMYWERAKRVLY